MATRAQDKAEGGDDQGASPVEQLIGACRRDNTSVVTELFSSRTPDEIAELVNSARDGLGNYSLHVAALSGSYDVLEELLDQEGVEVDPVAVRDGDTPLHKAVRYINQEWSGEANHGILALVEILIEAGADPRVRNKAKLKPMELADPRNSDLRVMLQKAEYSQMAGNDVVDEDEDEGPTGSASDSD